MSITSRNNYASDHHICVCNYLLLTGKKSCNDFQSRILLQKGFLTLTLGSDVSHLYEIPFNNCAEYISHLEIGFFFKFIDFFHSFFK